MHRIIDTKLFKTLKYTDIKYKFKLCGQNFTLNSVLIFFAGILSLVSKGRSKVSFSIGLIWFSLFLAEVSTIKFKEVVRLLLAGELAGWTTELLMEDSFPDVIKFKAG